METVSNKTLAYWKERAVTMRQLIEEFVGSAAHLKELKDALRYAYRKVEQIERKVLVCVLLLTLFVGGCNTVGGTGRLIQDVGKDVELIATGYENQLKN